MFGCGSNFELVDDDYDALVLKDGSRGERRDRTLRYARRAQGVHLAARLRARAWLSAWKAAASTKLDTSVWSFAKRKSLGCRCRRHKPGRPKVLQAICCPSRNYQPSVLERIEGRRLIQRWRGCAIDADELLAAEF